MRIFLDCTHTVKHRYKNTGIHRVVRKLTSELISLNSEDPHLDIIPVVFNGYSIQRAVDIHESIDRKALKDRSYLPIFFDLISKKISILFIKIKAKLIDRILINYALNNISFFRSKIRDINTNFEKTKFSQDDIYIIADANWDLPKSYYYFLESLKINQVVIGIICYDLIPIKFPEYCSKKFSSEFINFYNTYSTLFDKVLCISKNSAEDYINAQRAGVLSGNENSIISSFQLGCDFKSKFLIDNENYDAMVHHTKILAERYILIVGSLTPHKNIKSIIVAFNLVLSDNKNAHNDNKKVNLVFAGNKGWDLDTDRLIEDHEMYGERIHILSSVTDSQLDILYRNCYCLVQASFYEGFGLPVVEALQHGKPVIASTGGSLPEVGGKFCIYFDPNQPVELYESIKKLLTSDTEYNCLVERIKNEYKVLSWQESAHQFLDCIRV